MYDIADLREISVIGYFLEDLSLWTWKKVGWISWLLHILWIGDGQNKWKHNTISLRFVTVNQVEALSKSCWYTYFSKNSLFTENILLHKIPGVYLFVFKYLKIKIFHVLSCWWNQKKCFKYIMKEMSKLFLENIWRIFKHLGFNFKCCFTQW